MASEYRGIYQHRPISENGDEIRVLELLPRAGCDSVRVILRHVPFHVDKEEQLSYAHDEDRISHPDRGCSDSDGFPASRANDDEPEPYEAISYVWGSVLDRTAVSIVDGLDYWSLGVTCNCAEALRSLRYEKKSRLLWVDAICINQGTTANALAERGRQVQLMAHIFKRATRVVAWLGPSIPGDQTVADWIDNVAANVRPDESWWTNPVEEGGKWGNARYANIDRQQCSALDAFIGRAWWAIPSERQHVRCADMSFDRFSRLWIWQEILLGSDSSILASGKVEILFSRFQLAILYLKGKAFFLPPSGGDGGITRLDLLHDICDKSNRFGIKILSQLRSCRCTDPRDRIYVAQNLAPHATAKIAPDYIRSWQECYTDWAWQHLRDMKDLSFLSCLEENTALDHCTPSWVPDWSRTKIANPLVGWAAAGTYASYTCADDRSLCVKGIVVGKVTDVHFDEESMRYESPGQSILCLHRLVKFALPKESTTTNEEFCRVICNDQLRESFVPPPASKLPLSECRGLVAQVRDARLPDDCTIMREDLGSMILDVSIGGDKLETTATRVLFGPRGALQGDTPVCNDQLRESYESPAASKSSSSDWELFLAQLRVAKSMVPITIATHNLDRKILEFANGRTMLKFSGGRLGLGPRGASQGDTLVVLLGCHLPVLLRRLPDGKFKVVGEATCSGVMAGEALLGDLPPEFEFAWATWHGALLPGYRDRNAKVTSSVDPRLATYVPLEGENSKDHGHLQYIEFRPSAHNTSGKYNVEEFQKRGVKFEDFVLV